MKYNSKRKVRRDRTEIAAEVIAVLLSLVFISLVIIPVLNTISVALSSGTAETAGKVLLLPVDFQLTTIKAIIFDTDFLLALYNSMFVTVFGVIFSLFVSILFAYALSSRYLRGKKIFLLLCIVVIGIKYTNYKNNKQLATYQIFLQDVDGLIVGSPVKYMGVQVGHIQKIKILTNDVYVKFVITEKGLKLPQGVIANVEFNGLGGSKSLEIYPPTLESISSKKLVYVKDTNRLSSTVWRLDDMFDKLNAICVKLSTFANNTGFLPSSAEQVDIKKIQENLDNFDEKLQEYTDERQHFKEKIKELKDE